MRKIGNFFSRLKKLINKQKDMQDISKYPHFIPDKPIGVDCFDGHSQERLAHGVCSYVRMIDIKPEKSGDSEVEFDASMPRIIGLEGSWGSGKSNVVNMIGRELDGEGYYTFTYDAWGHQEDLQRRSILETMTNQLIQNNVLQGEVKIQLRNGKPNKDTWTNQLSLLLSNKTTSIHKSTPKLTAAAFWGIGIIALFAICSLFADQLIQSSCDFTYYWWIDVIPILFALLVIGFYLCKDGSFNNVFRMIDYTNHDTIEEEYTSSEEPSVAEFKNWMKAISDHLARSEKKYKRLIIVFDNMDRLPSEKVMQLWSSIYTFFAGGEFERVWAIIPYDYVHLCQAIYGNEDNNSKEEKESERIKQFISKTFPITYHIPQPVITDYRKLFNTYFEKAFGPNIHDKEHICQVFMHLMPNPNPRSVIKFVNELVAMHLQWSNEKFRLQNQALYILKKDFLFYSRENLDTQLLSEKLFDKVDPFFPEQDKVRTEICQYAYGLEDEKLASELPLRNELKRLVGLGASVSDYVARPNFLSVFENVINETDQTSLKNAVRSMASLDRVNLQQEIYERIQSKWDFLANLKASSSYNSHQYDETLTILIKHATNKRVNELARSFVKAMQRIWVSDGAKYYYALNQLQQSLGNANVEFDDTDWYNLTICEPEQFIQYVCEAKEHFNHYRLTSDNNALNEYLLKGAISGNSDVATVVDYIKDEASYDLTALKVGLSKAIAENTISQNICVAAYVHRVLDSDEGILKVRFNPNTVTSYFQAGQAPWQDDLPIGLEDVMAMSLADGQDISDIDEQMLPRICSCMERYFTYTHLLKNTGKEGTAFRKLNVYCIEHLEGKNLDTQYVARHLQELQNALGLDFSKLLAQFNRWSSINWGDFSAENQFVMDVKNYVHQAFFEAYRDNPGNFSNSIISLGVEALKFQNTGFLVRLQQVRQFNRMMPTLIIDDYWKCFVETFLGTSYMKEASDLLTEEAMTMLQWLYDHNEVKEPDLLETILQHPHKTTLKSYIYIMMNDSCLKTDISKEKFQYFGKLLPLLGSNMDDNTARGLITHFIKPIYNDNECAAIIVSNGSFYIDVMRHDITIASPIIKEMSKMDTYQTIISDLKDLLSKLDNSDM